MEKCQKSNTVEDKHIKTSTFCHSRHPSYNPRIKKNIERTATIARCTIWKDFRDLATPAIIIKGSNLIAHRDWLLQSHKHPKMPPAITIATLLLITNSVSSGVATCLGRVLCLQNYCSNSQNEISKNRERHLVATTLSCTLLPAWRCNAWSSERQNLHAAWTLPISRKKWIMIIQNLHIYKLPFLCQWIRKVQTQWHTPKT